MLDGHGVSGTIGFESDLQSARLITLQELGNCWVHSSKKPLRLCLAVILFLLLLILQYFVAEYYVVKPMQIAARATEFVVLEIQASLLLAFR